MNLKNKRKVLRYSGNLCMISMITATSLYLSESSEANAVMRTGFNKIGSAVSNTVRSLTSRSSSIGGGNKSGLKVVTDPQNPVKKLISFFDGDGTQTVFPRQSANPKEKLIWPEGSYGVKHYTGSDGTTQRRFAYKVSSGSSQGAPVSSTSSSGSVSSTSSASSASSSSSDKSSSGARYTSQLRLKVTKEGDNIRFIEQDRTTTQTTGAVSGVKTPTLQSTRVSTTKSGETGGGTTEVTLTGPSGTKVTVTAQTSNPSKTAPRATGYVGSNPDDRPDVQKVILESTQQSNMQTSGSTSSTTASLSGVSLSAPQSTPSGGSRTVTKLGSASTPKTQDTKTTTSTQTSVTSTTTTAGTTTTTTTSSSGEGQGARPKTSLSVTSTKTSQTGTGDDGDPGVQRAILESIESNRQTSRGASSSTASLSGVKLATSQPTSGGSGRTISKLGSTSTSEAQDTKTKPNIQTTISATPAGNGVMLTRTTTTSSESEYKAPRATVTTTKSGGGEATKITFTNLGGASSSDKTKTTPTVTTTTPTSTKTSTTTSSSGVGQGAKPKTSPSVTTTESIQTETKGNTTVTRASSTSTSKTQDGEKRTRTQAQMSVTSEANENGTMFTRTRTIVSEGEYTTQHATVTRTRSGKEEVTKITLNPGGASSSESSLGRVNPQQLSLHEEMIGGDLQHRQNRNLN